MSNTDDTNEVQKESSVDTSLTSDPSSSSSSNRPLRKLLPKKIVEIEATQRLTTSPRQQLVLKICLVCRKSRCTLKGHQAYAERKVAFLTQKKANRDHGTNTFIHPVDRRREQPPLDCRISWQIENPRVDPFAKYPLPTTSEDHELLDLWTQPWPGTHHGPSRHLFPRPTINAFAPFVMASATFFRAFLSVAATRVSLAKGSMDAVSVRQAADAEKLHAAACIDDKAAGSDDNIMAALCIMSNFMAKGDALEAARYTDRVNALVKSRGGPQYLGMNGVAAGYLFYADHALSIWHHRKPVWQMPLPSLEFPNPPGCSAIGAGFETLRGSLSQPVLDLAENMCRLTRLYEVGFKKKVPPQSLTATGYLSMVCEYQLAELLYSYETQTPSLESCVCLALLLMDHVILRNHGVVNPLIRRIERQFWEEVKTTRDKGLWSGDQYACLLIWVLFTGLAVTIRARSLWHEYAIKEIRFMKARVGLGSFEDVRRRVLEPYCWLDVASEVTFSKLWDEVESPDIRHKDSIK